MICFQTGGSSSHESFSLALPKRLFLWRPSVESRFSWFRRRRRRETFRKNPGPRSWAIWPPKKKERGASWESGSDGFVMFFFCCEWRGKKQKFQRYLKIFYIFHPQNGRVFRGNWEQTWWIFQWSFCEDLITAFCKLLNFGQGALDIMDALIIAQANPFIKAGLVGVGWFGFGGGGSSLLGGNMDTPPKFNSSPLKNDGLEDDPLLFRR